MSMPKYKYQIMTYKKSDGFQSAIRCRENGKFAWEHKLGRHNSEEAAICEAQEILALRSQGQLTEVERRFYGRFT